MTRIGKSMASAIVSLSLIVGSTAAAASTQAVAPAATPASDGWMALSMLTPASASVLGSSSAVAAQPEGPPPPPPGYYSRSGTPPLPVIIVWLATIGVFIYIITKGNSSQRPNSPF